MMMFFKSTEDADNITRLSVLSKNEAACLKLAWRYFFRTHAKGIPVTI